MNKTTKISIKKSIIQILIDKILHKNFNNEILMLLYRKKYNYDRRIDYLLKSIDFLFYQKQQKVSDTPIVKPHCSRTMARPTN